MKRILGYMVLILATLGGLLWPLVAQIGADSDTSPASDPVVIAKYEAGYDVAADGNMAATETITAKFPSGRHGIFRFWDVTDPSDSKVRLDPTLTSITMDGAPVQYQTSWESGGKFYVAKIGDPDRFVTPGAHVYKIAYTVPGVISPISAGAGKEFVSALGTQAASSESDFYWNVVAQGWQMAIEQATIQITLPSASGLVQCTAGAPARSGFSQGPCLISGAGTNRLTLTAKAIPPRSGMTVRATMAPPPPLRDSLPWGVAWDDILGTKPAEVGLAVGLMVLAAAIGLLLALRARETEPGFPVMYAPPAGLGPVQTVYIDTESPGSHGLTSSLFYMADKRLVTLERRSDDTWLVTGQGTPEQWSAVDPVTARMAVDLEIVNPGFWFLADRTKGAGQILQHAKANLDSASRSWAQGQGLIRGSAVEKWSKVLWWLCLVGAVVGFIGILGPTMWGMPLAGYVIGGFGVMQTGVGMRRTQAGRRAWSEAGGFKRLLATDSSEARFDFAAQKDLFISFVPFAVAFGVADKWAAKYKVATGQDAPSPFWYPYGVGMGVGLYGGGGGFDSFDSALSASIGAYQASQSSSSGGGGGGFGGGGGGGGGGSW